MFGSRMAMEKLQAMDESYASRIGELISNRPAVASAAADNSYLAGYTAPVANLGQTRQQINEMELTAADRNEYLREAALAELGAAGRYGIPAAGAGLGVAGIGAIAGEQPVAPAGPVVIDYNSPAHGSNLAPESHAIYKEVHQGLMNGTVSSEELRAAVRSGQFDHDPALVNHFLDVMG